MGVSRLYRTKDKSVGKKDAIPPIFDLSLLVVSLPLKEEEFTLSTPRRKGAVCWFSLSPDPLLFGKFH
jgi:hypothetical protein